MKKKLTIGFVIFSLATLTIINAGIDFNNHSNNIPSLTLANITAMAADTEGPITDPNIALHHHLETVTSKDGKYIGICCLPRNYDDQCNYKFQKGDCSGKQ